jgi:hypothetical protein
MLAYAKAKDLDSVLKIHAETITKYGAPSL